MIASDFIVKYLSRHLGVSSVFTYAGGTNAPLLDALHRYGIRYVPTRHECNAAFAAEGYARASRGAGLAIAMSGPGATNLVTGIANAYFDSSRVFYLTGQVVTHSYKFDRPVRQLGYQETDIVSVVKPITKYATLVARADQVAAELRKCVSILVSGRTGPVLYDVPFDVLRSEVPEGVLDEPPVPAPRPILSEAIVAAIEGEILRAERPLLIAGGGVRLAGCADFLREAAERYQLPVALSLLGKDAFPNDHPLCLGFLGAYGTRPTNIAVNNADLLLVLGSRLDSRQTSAPPTFARGAVKIHVDIDRTELNNTIPCDITVNADLGDFLEKLLARPGGGHVRAGWLSYIGKLKAEFRHDFARTDRLVTPIPFMEELSAAADADAVFTVDVGCHQMWAAKALGIRKGQRFLTSGGLGSMGFALPAAIGAYLATGRQVVCILGDGGMQMSLPELSTIQVQRMPIKIVVVNNGVLGLMKNFQDENYGGSYPATVWGYGCPDFEKIAACYDIPARTVGRDEEVAGALRELLQPDGARLLNVLVDREHKPYPKVLPGKPLQCQAPDIGEERLRSLMLESKTR